jgi:hypothetical protein
LGFCKLFLFLALSFLSKFEIKSERNWRDKMANRPVQKWRVGNIEAALWENRKTVFDGTEVTFRTVTLSRGYKKKDEDIWRSEVINSIRRNDIPKLVAVLGKAQDYLMFESTERDLHEDDKDE